MEGYTKPPMKQYIKKVCLLGQPAVGKTSLIRRYVTERFDDSYLSTIGAKPTSKTIEVDKITKRKKEIPAPPPEPPAYQQGPSFQPQPYSQPPNLSAYPASPQPQGFYPQQFYYPQQPISEPSQKLGFWKRFFDRFQGRRATITTPPLLQAPPLQPYSTIPIQYFPPQIPLLPPPEYEDVTERVKLTLLIWDIAGQLDQSKSNTPLQRNFFAGAEGALLVGDCSRPQTIQDLYAWTGNFREVVGKKPVIFIGNKSDLVPQDSLAEIENLFAELDRRFDATHIITSAKTGVGVEDSFKKLGALVVR